MKVTAFNGSPRKGGNTELLINLVLEPLKEAGIDTELVQIAPGKIRGCMACFKCRENQDKQCIIKNDPLNEYIEKMINSDAILLGSPSYFSGVSSDMKALIDRAGFVCTVNGRLLENKIGAAVVAHRRGGAVNVMDAINRMFLMSKMIVPGSTYWNFGVGMEKGDVLSDEEAKGNMRDLGERILWLLNKINK